MEPYFRVRFMSRVLASFFAVFTISLVLGLMPKSLAQTQTSEATAETPKKFGGSYWAMVVGPAVGQGIDTNTTASGDLISGSYFQILFMNYMPSKNTQTGVQVRANTDFKVGGLSVLNPRVYWLQKNVINNDWMTMSLQPFLEIPTTSVWRERTNLASVLFAQNFSFKIPDPNWAAGITTMINGRFYREDQGHSTFEVIGLPFFSYNLNKTWQVMGWGWFDWNHRGGTAGSLELDNFSDDYVRLGMNYFLRDNVQLYPCVQVYTGAPRANNTTLGFEVAAQF